MQGWSCFLVAPGNNTRKSQVLIFDQSWNIHGMGPNQACALDHLNNHTGSGSHWALNVLDLSPSLEISLGFNCFSLITLAQVAHWASTALDS
jgi:hypothetical protein